MIGTYVAALRAETVKATASRPLWATLALTVVGVGILAATLLIAIRSGRDDLTAKLGRLARFADWTALVGAGHLVTAAGGLLALGVGLTWIFGREFSDDTVGGLFGQPASLSTVALAKITVFFGWTGLMAISLPLALLAGGLGVGLGQPDAAAWAGLLREAGLVALSALLALPCAWVATLGRGLLPGVASAVAILVMAQVSSLAAPEAVSALTAPALWATTPTAGPSTGLVGTAAVAIAASAATVWTWRRLQLDR